MKISGHMLFRENVYGPGEQENDFIRTTGFRLYNRISMAEINRKSHLCFFMRILSM